MKISYLFVGLIACLAVVAFVPTFSDAQATAETPWSHFNQGGGSAWSANIADGSWCPILTGCTADFIFVGGGPSGSIAAFTTAKLLTRAHIRLITAGVEYLPEQPYSETWWSVDGTTPNFFTDIIKNKHHWSVEGAQVNYRTQYHPECTNPGGCQMYNGEVCQENDDDYWNQWASDVNDNTFSATNIRNIGKIYENYKNLPDPYNLHGHDGPMVLQSFPNEPAWYAAVTSKFAAQVGIPILNDTNSGVYGIGNAIRNIDSGPGGANPVRQVAYFKAYKPLTQDGTGKRTVVLQATVTKLIYHPRFPNKVIGVSYYNGKTKEMVTEYALREVIITAGALETPKLIQENGIGNCVELAVAGVDCVYNSPQVGENLMNEAVIGLVAIVPFDEVRRNDSGIIARWRSPQAIARGDILADSMLSVVRLEAIDQMDSTVVLFNCQQNRYAFRGKTNLFESDHHTESNTTFNMFLTPNGLVPDIDVLANCWLEARTLIGSLNGFELPPTSAIPSDPAAIATYLLTNPNGAMLNYHIQGTMKMKKTPTFDPLPFFASQEEIEAVNAAKANAALDGAVDSRFRVIGIDGLRVCDNSVCPIQHVAHASQSTAMRLGPACGNALAARYSSILG